MPLTESYFSTREKKQKKSSTQDYLSQRYGRLEGGDESKDDGNLYDFMGSALWGAASGLSWGVSDFANKDDEDWADMNSSERSGWILGEGLSLMAPVVGPFALLGRASRLAVKGSNKFVGKAVSNLSKDIVQDVGDEVVEAVVKHSNTATDALGKTIINNGGDLANQLTKKIGQMTDDAATGVRWTNQLKGAVDDVSAATSNLVNETHSIVKSVFKEAGEEINDNTVRRMAETMVKEIGQSKNVYANDISELVTRGLMNKYPNWMGDTVSKYVGMAANDMAIMTMHSGISGLIKEQSKDEEFSTTSTLGHSAMMALMFPAIRGLVKYGGMDKASTGIKGYFKRFKKTDYDAMLAAEGGESNVKNLLRIMVEGEGKAVFGSSHIKDSFWQIGKKKFHGAKLLDKLEKGELSGADAVGLLKKMNLASSKEFMRIWKPKYGKDLIGSVPRMTVGVLATNQWMLDPEAWKGDMESSEIASHIFMSAIMTKSRGHWGKKDQQLYFNKLSPYQNLSARLGLSNEKLNDFIQFHDDTKAYTGLGAAEYNTVTGKKVLDLYDKASKTKGDAEQSAFVGNDPRHLLALELEPHYNAMGQFKHGTGFRKINVRNLNKNALEDLIVGLEAIELKGAGNKTIKELGSESAMVEITDEIGKAGERTYKQFLEEISNELGLDVGILNKDGKMSAKFLVGDEGQSWGVLRDVAQLIESFDSMNIISASGELNLRDAFKRNNQKRLENKQPEITIEEYVKTATEITNKWMGRLNAEYEGANYVQHLIEGNPFFEHIINAKYVKATNRLMMVAQGSGTNEAERNFTASIDKFFKVPGKNEYYSLESIIKRLPNVNDKGQNELDPTHKEWNNVNQMIETVEMANNLVNLRKAATGAGTNHGSTSMKRIAANEVSTLDNLFKSNFNEQGLPIFFKDARIKDMMMNRILKVKGFDQRALRSASNLFDENQARINTEGKIEILDKDVVINRMKKDGNSQEDIKIYSDAFDTVERTLGKDNLLKLKETAVGETKNEKQDVLNVENHIDGIVREADKLTSFKIKDLETKVTNSLEALNKLGGSRYEKQLKTIYDALENIVNSQKPKDGTVGADVGSVKDPITELRKLSIEIDKLKLTFKSRDSEINKEHKQLLDQLVLSLETIENSIDVETKKWVMHTTELIKTGDQDITEMSEYDIRKKLIENPQKILVRLHGFENDSRGRMHKLVNSLMNSIAGGHSLSAGAVRRHTDNLVNKIGAEIGKQGQFKELSDVLDYVEKGGSFAFSEIREIIGTVQNELNRDVIAKNPILKDAVHAIDSLQDRMQIHEHTKTLVELATDFGFSKDGKVDAEWEKLVLSNRDGAFKSVEDYLNERFSPAEAKTKWEEFEQYAPGIINSIKSQGIATQLSLQVQKGAGHNIINVDGNKITKRFATMKYIEESEIRMAFMDEIIPIIDSRGIARNVNLSSYDNPAEIQKAISSAWRRSVNAEKPLAETLRFGGFSRNEMEQYIRDASDTDIGSEQIVFVRLSPKDKMAVPINDANLRPISRKFNEWYDEFMTDPDITGDTQRTFKQYMSFLKDAKMDNRAIIELKILLPYLSYTGKKGEIVKLFTELTGTGADKNRQDKLFKIQANIFKRGFLSDGGTTTPLSIEANDYIIESRSGVVRSAALKYRGQGNRLIMKLYDDEAAENWEKGRDAQDQHELNNRRTVHLERQEQINLSTDSRLRGLLRQSQEELSEQGSLNSSRLDGVKYASRGLMAYVMDNKGQFNINFLDSANGAKTIISAVGENQLLGKGYLVYDPKIAGAMGDADILLGTSSAKTLWGKSFQSKTSGAGVELVSPQRVGQGNFADNIRNNSSDINKMYIGIDELSVSFTSKMGGKVSVPSSQFDWQSPSVVKQWIAKSKFKQSITEFQKIYGDSNGEISTDVAKRLMDIEIENGNPMVDGHSSTLKLILEFGGSSEMPYITAAVNRLARNFIIKNVGKNVIDTGSDMFTTPDMEGTLGNSFHVKLWDSTDGPGSNHYERVSLQYGGVGVGKSSTHRVIGTGSNPLQDEIFIARDKNGIDWTVRLVNGEWLFNSTFYDKMGMIDAEPQGHKGATKNRKIKNTQLHTIDGAGAAGIVEARELYDSGKHGKRKNRHGDDVNTDGEIWKIGIQNALEKVNEIAAQYKLNYYEVHELINNGVTSGRELDVIQTNRTGKDVYNDVVVRANSKKFLGKKLNGQVEDGKIQFGMLNTAVPTLGKDQVINRVQRINTAMNGLIEVNVNDLRNIMQRDNDGDHLYTQTRPDAEILNAFLLEQGKVNDFPIFSNNVKKGVKTLDDLNAFGLDLSERKAGFNLENTGFTQYANQVETQSRAIGTFIGQRGVLTWASRMGLNFGGGVNSKGELVPTLKKFWERFDVGSEHFNWLTKFMVVAQNSVDYHDGKLPIFDTTEILLDFVLYGKMSQATKDTLIKRDANNGNLKKMIDESASIFESEASFIGNSSFAKSEAMQRKSLGVIIRTLKKVSMVSNDTFDEKGKRTPLPHEFEKAYRNIESLLDPKTSTKFIARQVYREIGREWDKDAKGSLTKEFIDTFFGEDIYNNLNYTSRDRIMDELAYYNGNVWSQVKTNLVNFNVKSAQEGLGLSIPGNMLNGLMTTRFGDSIYGGVDVPKEAQVDLQRSIGNYIDGLEHYIEVSEYQKKQGWLNSADEVPTIDMSKIAGTADNNVRKAIQNGFIIEVLSNKIGVLKSSLDFEISDSFPSTRKINSLKSQIATTQESIAHMDRLAIENLVIYKDKADLSIQRGDGEYMNLGWIDKGRSYDATPKKVSVYRISDKAHQFGTGDFDQNTLKKSKISYLDLEYLGDYTSATGNAIKKHKGYTYVVDLNKKNKLQATDVEVTYGDALSRFTARDVQDVKHSLGESYDSYTAERGTLLKRLYAISIQAGANAKDSAVFKNSIYGEARNETGYDLNRFIDKWASKIDDTIQTESMKDGLELLVGDLLNPTVSGSKYSQKAGFEVPVFQVNKVILDNVFDYLKESKINRLDIMKNVISGWEKTKTGENPDDLRAEIYYEQGFDNFKFPAEMADPLRSLLEIDRIYYSSPALQDAKRRYHIHATEIRDKKVGGRIMQTESFKKISKEDKKRKAFVKEACF